MILGVLLLAANVGLIYWIQARRSTARIRELEAELQQRDEQPAPATPETMLFRSEGQDVRVEAAQIRYVEGMSEYIKIWMDGVQEPLIVLERLKNLEKQLPAGHFLRVHRSYIVNLARIRATGADGITLDDGTHVPVGDSYRDRFRKTISQEKTC
ncbi:MAG: LytTR family transcriptional regulator [Bacteroidales bacterium]|nr:LytTR family transcriptional regulator [Bacteroidales bacterium]